MEWLRGFFPSLAETLLDYIDDAILAAVGEVPSVHEATVLRKDPDGTVWVRIPGGADETPCASSTVSVEPGDTVTVSISGGRARVIGNSTRPATDDAAARRAQQTAAAAGETAEEAMGFAVDAATSAGLARESAEAAAEAAGTANANALRAISDAADAASAASAAQSSADAAGEAAASAGASAQAAASDAASARSEAASATESANAAGRAASAAQAAAEAAQGDIDGQRTWFWHDELGAHVLGDDEGYRTDLRPAGMEVVDASDSTVVASFGKDGARIGGGGSSVAVTPEGFLLTDSEGSEVLRQGFLFDPDGSVEERFTPSRPVDGLGAAVNESISLSGMAERGSIEVYTVSTDGTETPVDGSDYTVAYRGHGDGRGFVYGTTITFGWGGLDESVAEYLVRYTASRNYPQFFYGTRRGDAGRYGAYSATLGMHVDGSGARGSGSLAAGYITTASGDNAVALGSESVASGESSHAQNSRTIASGESSHAQNRGTIASSESQTALGRWNVEDADGGHAVIVGNGESEGARSNAATLDWSGDAWLAGALDAVGARLRGLLEGVTARFTSYIEAGAGKARKARLSSADTYASVQSRDADGNYKNGVLIYDDRVETDNGVGAKSKGGSHVNAKNIETAAFYDQSLAVTDSSSYHTLLAAKSTDGSTIHIGAMNNTLWIGRIPADQTENNAGVVWHQLNLETGGVMSKYPYSTDRPRPNAGASHANARVNLNCLGVNPITTTAQDTNVDNWRNIGPGYAFFGPEAAFDNKPSAYGLLINVPYQSECHQIWMTQNTGYMYHRGANSGGWGDTAWRRLAEGSEVDPIGWDYSNYGSGTAAANVDTIQRVAGVWLPAGKYAIFVRGDFASVASNAWCACQVAICNDDGSIRDAMSHRVHYATQYWSRLTMYGYINNTTGRNVWAGVSCSVARNISGAITAVRIK